MCERIYVLLEIVNIVLCLHYLWGKKPKINLGTVLVICTDVLIFELINQYDADMAGYVLMYFLIFVYTVSEFGSSMPDALLGNVLYILLLGTAQLLVNLPFLVLHIPLFSENVSGIYTNIMVMLLLFFLKQKLHFLFDLATGKRGVHVFIIVISGGAVILSTFRYKLFLMISIEELLIILIFGSLICILSYCWQAEREKVRIKQVELQMHKCYDESFKELIKTIRERQHDFHNHIQAVKSLHYSIQTYDELVAEQDKYCDALMEDNRFYGLLNVHSPALTGFLYGRFKEADAAGVRIEYSVKIRQSITSIPEYILVEIAGILLDNAMEAVLENEHKGIEFYLSQEEDMLSLEVGNPVENVSYTDVSMFFKAGYSKKAEHTGLGLYKVFQYSRKYGFDVIAKKQEKKNQEWLFIKINYGSCPR